MGDNNKGNILSTFVYKLLESADLSSSLGRSNAITKVLIWKTIISKVLEETQKEIGSLENELKTIESQSQSGHNPEAFPISPSDDRNIEKRPLSPNLHDSREDTLCQTIISCNREIVERSCAVFDKFWPTKCRKIMCSSSLSQENAVIKKKFAEKEWFGRFKEKVLITKHKALDHLWKKDMLLRSLRKNPPTSHSNFESGLQTISNGCHRNRSSTRHRFPFPAGKKLSLVPTSEMINFTSQLLSESRNEIKKSILKTPSLILDEKNKMISIFKSTNGVVEDPLGVEKERAMINPWTSDERKIYLEKFRAFGKDFRKIASFLDHKTTADCVEFYYKSHKPDCFEKDKKRKSDKSEKLCATKTGLRVSGRKRNLKVNVDSQKKLSETPMKKRGIVCNGRTRSGRLFLWRKHEDTKISTGDDNITRRSNSNNLGIVLDEKERVVTDVSVGLCDSHPTDPLEAGWDEVNIVKAKSDTNKNGDWRNMNHDEPQHVENRDVSESTKIISMVSSDCIIVQNIMEEGDKVTEFVPAYEIVQSPMNEVNVDRDEVNVVEAKLDSNKKEDQKNLNHNEFQPVEDGNVSESTEIISIVSSDGIIMQNIIEEGDKVTEFVPAYEIVESPMNEVNVDRDEVNVLVTKSDSNKNEDQKNLNHDDSQIMEGGNVSETTDTINMISNECIIMQDIMDMGDEVTKLVSASETVEPCQTHSVAEHGLVSERLAELPTRLDGKCEYDESNLATDGYGVVLYNSDKSSSASDERATIIPDMMEVRIDKVRGVVTEVVSASKIIVSCQTHSIAEEDILVSENTLLQNSVDTSVQQEITTLQPQDGNDKLNSMSIGGNYQLHNPGISLKDPVDRQVKEDISCSSSSTATELLQNIEHTEVHEKSHWPGSSDSKIAPTDAVVFKLFGKIIIVPSPAEKHDLTVKENGESGERPWAEDSVNEQVVCRERPKRRVSEPKYLKDYLRFK